MWLLTSSITQLSYANTSSEVWQDLLLMVLCAVSLVPWPAHRLATADEHFTEAYLLNQASRARAEASFS
jgi:hypothetical protein